MKHKPQPLQDLRSRLSSVGGVPWAIALVVFGLSACASTRPVETGSEHQPALVLVAVSGSESTDAVLQKIQTTGAAGVLVDVGDDAARLLNDVKARGLRRIARMSLSGAGDAADPADLSHRRQMLRQWLQTHELDGLHIAATPLLTDQAEAIAAEARLVHDALVVSTNLDLPRLTRGTLTAALRDSSRTDDLWTLNLGSAPATATPVALDLSGFISGDSVRIGGRAEPLAVDAGGRIAWLCEELPDTLILVHRNPAHRNTDTIFVSTNDWNPPFDYALSAAGVVSRIAPWVELRRSPGATTSAGVYEILGRTDSAASATINGVAAHVYKTGVFFDSVEFVPGVNHLLLRSETPAGTAIYSTQINFEPHQARPPLPLWIDERSLTPSEDLELLESDHLLIQFKGAIGHTAVVRLEPGGPELSMTRTDVEDASIYSAQLPIRLMQPGHSYRLKVTLRSLLDKTKQHRLLETTLLVRAGIDEFPLLRTTGDRCPISYSLGRVRLGGPFLAEYGAGVVLQSSGRFGRYHRIRLGPTQIAYIHERYVEALPAGSIPPGFHIASLHARPREDADVVSIPWSEPVPYSVYPDPGGRRILVTMYGVQTTSTWVQQRAGLRYVERLSWEQLDAETYRVAIHLTTPMIWGYELQPQGKSLVLRLPYPRPVDPDAEAGPDRPLAGMRIAIEAGHGGTNTGAVGLSGLLEKDVNLDTSLRLGELCEAAGAEVIQLRSLDEGVPYMARIDSLERSDTDLVVSIHANSAGGGFLRASGTSTYYHNPFWEPFARRVYDRMLELDYKEFGVVGSFNYRNIRLSSRPAILVEQAFMSHARDEEGLADPDHRQEIAQKVLAGIVDYLAELRSSEANLGPRPQPEPEGADR